MKRMHRLVSPTPTWHSIPQLRSLLNSWRSGSTATPPTVEGRSTTTTVDDFMPPDAFMTPQRRTKQPKFVGSGGGRSPSREGRVDGSSAPDDGQTTVTTTHEGTHGDPLGRVSKKLEWFFSTLDGDELQSLIPLSARRTSSWVVDLTRRFDDEDDETATTATVTATASSAVSVHLRPLISASSDTQAVKLLQHINRWLQKTNRGSKSATLTAHASSNMELGSSHCVVVSVELREVRVDGGDGDTDETQEEMATEATEGGGDPCRRWTSEAMGAAPYEALVDALVDLFETDATAAKLWYPPALDVAMSRAPASRRLIRRSSVAAADPSLPHAEATDVSRRSNPNVVMFESSVAGLLWAALHRECEAATTDGEGDALHITSRSEGADRTVLQLVTAQASASVQRVLAEVTITSATPKFAIPSKYLLLLYRGLHKLNRSTALDLRVALEGKPCTLPWRLRSTTKHATVALMRHFFGTEALLSVDVGVMGAEHQCDVHFVIPRSRRAMLAVVSALPTNAAQLDVTNTDGIRNSKVADVFFNDAHFSSVALPLSSFGDAHAVVRLHLNSARANRAREARNDALRVLLRRNESADASFDEGDGDGDGDAVANLFGSRNATFPQSVVDQLEACDATPEMAGYSVSCSAPSSSSTTEGSPCTTAAEFIVPRPQIERGVVVQLQWLVKRASSAVSFPVTSVDTPTTSSHGDPHLFEKGVVDIKCELLEAAVGGFAKNAWRCRIFALSNSRSSSNVALCDILDWKRSRAEQRACIDVMMRYFGADVEAFVPRWQDILVPPTFSSEESKAFETAKRPAKRLANSQTSEQCERLVSDASNCSNDDDFTSISLGVPYDVETPSSVSVLAMYRRSLHESVEVLLRESLETVPSREDAEVARRAVRSHGMDPQHAVIRERRVALSAVNPSATATLHKVQIVLEGPRSDEGNRRDSEQDEGPSLILHACTCDASTPTPLVVLRCFREYFAQRSSLHSADTAIASSLHRLLLTHAVAALKDRAAYCSLPTLLTPTAVHPPWMLRSSADTETPLRGLAVAMMKLYGVGLTVHLHADASTGVEGGVRVDIHVRANSATSATGTAATSTLDQSACSPIGTSVGATAAAVGNKACQAAFAACIESIIMSPIDTTRGKEGVADSDADDMDAEPLILLLPPFSSGSFGAVLTTELDAMVATAVRDSTPSSSKQTQASHSSRFGLWYRPKRERNACDGDNDEVPPPFCAFWELRLASSMELGDSEVLYVSTGTFTDSPLHALESLFTAVIDRRALHVFDGEARRIDEERGAGRAMSAVTSHVAHRLRSLHEVLEEDLDGDGLAATLARKRNGWKFPPIFEQTTLATVVETISRSYFGTPLITDAVLQRTSVEWEATVAIEVYVKQPKHPDVTAGDLQLPNGDLGAPDQSERICSLVLSAATSRSKKDAVRGAMEPVLRHPMLRVGRYSTSVLKHRNFMIPAAVAAVDLTHRQRLFPLCR